MALIMMVGPYRYAEEYLRPLLEKAGYTVVSIRTDNYAVESRKISPDVTVLTTLVYGSERGGFNPRALVRDAVRDRTALVVWSGMTMRIQDELRPDSRIKLVPKPAMPLAVAAAVQELLETKLIDSDP